MTTPTISSSSYFGEGFSSILFEVLLNWTVNSIWKTWVLILLAKAASMVNREMSCSVMLAVSSFKLFDIA